MQLRRTSPAAVILSVVLAAGRAVGAEEVAPERPSWRGSELRVMAAGTKFGDTVWSEAAHLFSSSELAFLPEWHFGEHLLVRGRLDLECMNPAYDLDRIGLGNAFVSMNVDSLVEPNSKIEFGAGLRLDLPVSAAAQAQTLQLAVGPELSVRRTFPVLAGLTVSYSGRLARRFHKYTFLMQQQVFVDEYSSLDSVGGPSSDICLHFDHPECDTFMRRGSLRLRNVEWGYAHGPHASLRPIERLSLEAGVLQIKNRLYDLEPVSVPGGLIPPVANSWLGSLWVVTGAVAYQATKVVSIDAGVSMLYVPARDGVSYSNRIAMGSLGVGFDVEGFVATLRASQN